jgi:hypothetical protein
MTTPLLTLWVNFTRCGNDVGTEGLPLKTDVWITRLARRKSANWRPERLQQNHEAKNTLRSIT